jgi:hypothetical protein
MSDDFPQPSEWSNEDWRDLTDSWRSHIDLLGTPFWTRIGAIILSFVLLIWGWLRRKQLLQFGSAD